MGRWEGTGLTDCLGRGWATARAENGRKEHNRLETGIGFSSSVSGPVILEMNLLEGSQLLSILYEPSLHLLQISTLCRP
jgi:hypothetical protein